MNLPLRFNSIKAIVLVDLFEFRRYVIQVTLMLFLHLSDQSFKFAHCFHLLCQLLLKLLYIEGLRADQGLCIINQLIVTA